MAVSPSPRNCDGRRSALHLVRGSSAVMSPRVHSLLMPPSSPLTSPPRLTPADNPSGDKYCSGTPPQPRMTVRHLALIGHWCKMKKTLVIFMSYCELIIRWDPLVKAHLLQTCGFSFLFFIQATFFQMKCCCRFFSQALSEPQGVTASIILLLICGTKWRKKPKTNKKMELPSQRSWNYYQ